MRYRRPRQREATISRSIGEADLASTECIDQRHIGQGDPYGRDGEMNLASLEGIDQRFAWTGSRTDREVDPFPYDEPRRKGFTEPSLTMRGPRRRPSSASAGCATARKARQHRRACPMAALMLFARGFLAGFVFVYFV